ncbi:hypothetical protein H0H81_003837 [Sphagnurus paluster]|uniref:BTB domain-containing protein n=1 Tax=Sphagnurus paluster TaxID=117069 RepID=A0A9P7GSN9_9AGAR|nr:hypothetical protein H0H81_003837 [Sphagnurus paluster]
MSYNAQHTSDSGPFRALSKHEKYFLNGGDLYFLIEHVHFRVHRYFFERESPFFQSRLCTPASPGAARQGSTEGTAIVLDDLRSDDFAKFLWVFYNPKYSLYKTTPADWKIILRLAHLWQFQEVKNLVVRELEKLELGDVDRIATYHRYDVDRRLLIPRYAALCEREEPLTLHEGMELGLETTLMIARAREYARGPSKDNGPRSPTAAGMEVNEMHSLIQTLFDIRPLEESEKNVGEPAPDIAGGLVSPRPRRAQKPTLPPLVPVAPMVKPTDKPKPTEPKPTAPAPQEEQRPTAPAPLVEALPTGPPSVPAQEQKKTHSKEPKPTAWATGSPVGTPVSTVKQTTSSEAVPPQQAVVAEEQTKTKTKTVEQQSVVAPVDSSEPATPMEETSAGSGAKLLGLGSRLKGLMGGGDANEKKKKSPAQKAADREARAAAARKEAEEKAAAAKKEAEEKAAKAAEERKKAAEEKDAAEKKAAEDRLAKEAEEKAKKEKEGAATAKPADASADKPPVPEKDLPVAPLVDVTSTTTTTASAGASGGSGKTKVTDNTKK